MVYQDDYLNSWVINVFKNKSFVLKLALEFKTYHTKATERYRTSWVYILENRLQFQMKYNLWPNNGLTLSGEPYN